MFINRAALASLVVFLASASASVVQVEERAPQGGLTSAPLNIPFGGSTIQLATVSVITEDSGDVHPATPTALLPEGGQGGQGSGAGGAPMPGTGATQGMGGMGGMPSPQQTGSSMAGGDTGSGSGSGSGSDSGSGSSESTGAAMPLATAGFSQMMAGGGVAAMAMVAAIL